MTHLAPARLTALAEACAADIWDQAHQRNLSDTLYLEGTAATLIAAAITAALAEAEPGSDRLLAALWRNIWDATKGQNYQRAEWVCRECRAHAPEKHEVAHAAGCALFGQDRALLASLDALDIKSGESV